MFPKFSKDPPNAFYVTLAGVFGVNQDIIEVHEDENIKMFYLNFVDIALEADEGVEKTKRHDLVLEIAIPCLKNCFPLVILSNSYLMICVCQI